MREAGYQAKTACGNLKLCTGFGAVIEGATHAVGQRILERARQKKNVEKERRYNEEEDDDKASGEERLMAEKRGRSRMM